MNRRKQGGSKGSKWSKGGALAGSGSTTSSRETHGGSPLVRTRSSCPHPSLLVLHIVGRSLRLRRRVDAIAGFWRNLTAWLTALDAQSRSRLLRLPLSGSQASKVYQLYTIHLVTRKNSRRKCMWLCWDGSDSAARDKSITAFSDSIARPLCCAACHFAWDVGQEHCILHEAEERIFLSKLHVSNDILGESIRELMIEPSMNAVDSMWSLVRDIDVFACLDLTSSSSTTLTASTAEDMGQKLLSQRAIFTFGQYVSTLMLGRILHCYCAAIPHKCFSISTASNTSSSRNNLIMPTSKVIIEFKPVIDAALQVSYSSSTTTTSLMASFSHIIRINLAEFNSRSSVILESIFETTYRRFTPYDQNVILKRHTSLLQLWMICYLSLRESSLNDGDHYQADFTAADSLLTVPLMELMTPIHEFKSLLLKRILEDGRTAIAQELVREAEIEEAERHLLQPLEDKSSDSSRKKKKKKKKSGRRRREGNAYSKVDVSSVSTEIATECASSFDERALITASPFSDSEDCSDNYITSADEGYRHPLTEEVVVPSFAPFDAETSNVRPKQLLQKLQQPLVQSPATLSTVDEEESKGSEDDASERSNKLRYSDNDFNIFDEANDGDFMRLASKSFVPWYHQHVHEGHDQGHISAAMLHAGEAAADFQSRVALSAEESVHGADWYLPPAEDGLDPSQASAEYGEHLDMPGYFFPHSLNSSMSMDSFSAPQSYSSQILHEQLLSPSDQSHDSLIHPDGSDNDEQRHVETETSRHHHATAENCSDVTVIEASLLNEDDDDVQARKPEEKAVVPLDDNSVVSEPMAISAEPAVPVTATTSANPPPLVAPTARETATVLALNAAQSTLANALLKENLLSVRYLVSEIARAVLINRIALANSLIQDLSASAASSAAAAASAVAALKQSAVSAHPLLIPASQPVPVQTPVLPLSMSRFPRHYQRFHRHQYQMTASTAGHNHPSMEINFPSYHSRGFHDDNVQFYSHVHSYAAMDDVHSAVSSSFASSSASAVNIGRMTTTPGTSASTASTAAVTEQRSATYLTSSSNNEIYEAMSEDGDRSEGPRARNASLGSAGQLLSVRALLPLKPLVNHPPAARFDGEVSEDRNNIITADADSSSSAQPLSVPLPVQQQHSQHPPQASVQSPLSSSISPLLTSTSVGRSAGYSSSLSPTPFSQTQAATAGAVMEAAPSISYNLSRSVDDRFLHSPLSHSIARFIGLLDGHELRLQRSLTEFVRRRRAKTESVSRLRAITKGLWPRSQVKIFGSFVTGLSLPSSDLDLVICLPKVHVEAGPEAPGALEGRNAIKETWQQNLFRCLCNEDWVELGSIKVIGNTLIPVLKLKTRALDGLPPISLDISFEGPRHKGLEASKLISSLIDKYAPIRPLVLVLKYFLSRRNLCEAYTGGLSSYAVFLLTARFLQELEVKTPLTQPTSRPRDLTLQVEDLGALLLGILRFYGDHFDPRISGVSVMRRCYFQRSAWAAAAVSSGVSGYAPHNSSQHFASSSSSNAADQRLRQFNYIPPSAGVLSVLAVQPQPSRPLRPLRTSSQSSSPHAGSTGGAHYLELSASSALSEQSQQLNASFSTSTKTLSASDRRHSFAGSQFPSSSPVIASASTTSGGGGVHGIAPGNTFTTHTAPSAAFGTVVAPAPSPFESYKFDPLCIEDPLEAGNNVGRNCFRVLQVQRCFSEVANAVDEELRNGIQALQAEQKQMASSLLLDSASMHERPLAITGTEAAIHPASSIDNSSSSGQSLPAFILRILLGDDYELIRA